MPIGVYEHKKGWKHLNETKAKISKSLMGHAPSEKARKALFKGDKATYSAFHRRVYKVNGKANYCASCGLSDINRKYFWANLTGNYHDIKDYISMCMPCHMKYDYQRRRLSGKKTSTI